MDVKSAFLYEKIEEEVYICQPPGSKYPDFLDKVYKVKKALYGLHQAPRAWFIEVKNASTLMETQKPLLKEEDVCACARYQVNLKVSHLHAVKRIFRYLKGQPKFGLWYLKDSPFDLVVYTDSDYAKESLDMKYTIGGCQFLRCRLILWQCKKQTVVANSITEVEYVAASSCYGQFWITAKAKSINEEAKMQIRCCLGWKRKPRRKVTEVPQPSDPMKHVEDKAIYKELDDRLVRVATTASSLEAEQDSGNINKTQSKATPNESSSQGTDSGGGPRCQDTMGILLLRLARILDLEKTKTTQALEIDSLKKRVKKLEKKQRTKTHKLKRLYKVGLFARVESSNNNEDLGEDASKQGRKFMILMLMKTSPYAAATMTIDEVTLAQAIMDIKSTKPKAKGIVLQEPSESRTTTIKISSKKSHDKELSCSNLVLALFELPSITFASAFLELSFTNSVL
uniref:Putative ribonuclease H-like domain-containing protein n=1 Tax=Tanacetum cinerariifolium TaxID=118510 RepID=A0A699IC62_TANCI|nr:putative ribonuclease H-like domain-containing protein [Tanacetum cinerariifolium]